MTTSASSPSSGALRRLGSAYLLLERIGTGAQGEVWRAKHSPEATGTWDPVEEETSAPHVDEELAAKILRAEIASQPGVLERFLAERATLMRVRSRSVVAVRDLVVEGGTFAIVMDLVDGGDLRGYLTKVGNLPPSEVARIGALIADGLAAVHEGGVLHRDIKPANVLLERHGEGEPVIPRLADFGVARICEAVGATTSTSAIGTPLYMAPEVLTGKVPPMTADVYSLGTMLYELACGVAPFVGSTPQVLASHARRSPGRPEGIPEALWELLELMQSKQAAERPSAAEAAERLRALEPSLRGLPAAPRLSKPPANRPAARPFEWDDPGEKPDSKAGSAAKGGRSGAAANGYGVQPSANSPQGLYGQVPAQAPVGYGLAVAGTAGTQLLAGGATTSVLAPPGAGGPVPAAFTYGGGSAPASLVPQAPKPRRRKLVAAGVAASLALLGLGGGGLWWYLSSDTGATFSAVPLQATVQERQRIADVSDKRMSRDNRMLATRSGSEWSLRDLNSSNHAPVWTGECWEGYFFNNEIFLCKNANNDRKFIGIDGQPKQINLAKEADVLGNIGELAIIREGNYEGSLLAMDSSGKQKWRVDGGYTKAEITSKFILTYESGSKRMQVLSAADGTILLSHPVERQPDWDKPQPGGIDINIGDAGFLVQGNPAVVYDAKGKSLGQVASAAGAPTKWGVPEPTEAAEFKRALESVPESSDRYERQLLAKGTDSAVLALDTNACAAKLVGQEVSFAAPTRTEGEPCALHPAGLIDSGAGILFTMGEPSSNSKAVGDQVVAYNRKTGEQTWQVKGSLLHVLPPQPGAKGDQAGAPRLLVQEGGNYGDLVIYAVIGN
ncbi:Serine/threonine-protein kinase PrkC [Actinomyces bovis]|uniref:non-specific serine/threonine protein kinase n=1 Tax=Actinomyces bovis TaxID=1658 RepID=A0ABY1VLT0_9ACTO|nr:serine/threonine-protein kinase [Actinomyces bovis]SPT52970.1 Serine/threonine-protein kinase PrkC [Actinomyces bovis]VEG55180.1 Serine/threonine-protein kinase PrkC [Actinomyces israelii]